MIFLRSCREKPKDSFEDSSNRPSEKKTRRKSTKAADTEAEISRYFMSAKPTSLDVMKPHGQRHQQDRGRSRDHESPQAFVDLPDRPFLGFGSCGPNTSISPAKIPVNTDSRSLHREDSWSPTRSTSYLTWSQSVRPSFGSPLLNRPYHVEPLTSSKLSNRKRKSPAPHKGQYSLPSLSPPCVPTTSSKTQDAASIPFSAHENANEGPSRNSESRSATGERLRLREKSQNHGDTGIIKLDAAKIPHEIEDSIADSTHPAETATHDGPESALLSRDEATCQSSRHEPQREPQREPQAYGVRPFSAQMPIISPHKDPLDDVLEALLTDCNTNVAGSDLASRATSGHRNLYVREEEGIPDRIQGYSRMPARAFVNSVYAPEASASAPKFSGKPRSASLQQDFPHDSSISTHTLSKGDLSFSNRPSLGYAPGYRPIESEVDSRSAWNGYGNLYERQQEQADPRPETSRENRPPYIALRENLSGSSRETDHTAARDEYAQKLHFVELGDGFDDHRPYLYKTVQEGNDNEDYEEIRHGEWDIDHGTSYDSGPSIFHESHEDSNHGIMAENNVSDYQRREINADHEQSAAQEADQDEVEPHQLFTTSIPDTYPSWPSHHIFSRDSGLERCAAVSQVHDVDAALSGFWTPHKLY